MHRWMPPCRLRSVPLYPNGRWHSDFYGFLAVVSSVKASWNCPRRCRMRLHLVLQAASARKILRFGPFSCPASWLSFSAFWRNGSWDLMIERMNSDLANTLGNLVNRTISMTNKYFGGVAVNYGVSDPVDESLFEVVTSTASKVTARMDKLRVADAITDRKSTRLNSSHRHTSRMPSSA